jgi:hypothetical protein
MVRAHGVKIPGEADLALSKAVIQLCFDAVAHPDEDKPYTWLKEGLLQQHSLTKYHRIDQLHAVGGGTDCSPSTATSRRGLWWQWTSLRSRMTARLSTRSRGAASAAASGAASMAVSEAASGEDSVAARETTP